MAAICDIHNHILPGMDDGCSCVEESLAVLTAAAEQGVHHLVATPHYYAQESIEDFLCRRQEAESQLRACLPEDMHLCVGAEVAWFNGISRCERLEALCIGKSRFLLLELPFAPWDSNLFRELRNLSHIRGVIPIVAHLERYLPLQTKDAVKKLLGNDVLVQMNAEYFQRFVTALDARRLFAKGWVQLLGTDCHNMTTRPFNLGQAMKKMKTLGLEKQLTQAAALSMEIFEAAMEQGDYARKEIR